MRLLIGIGILVVLFVLIFGIGTLKNAAEIILYCGILIALVPILGYFMAKSDIFFTFVESGNIKFVDAGESLVKIVHDIQGFHITEGSEPMSQKIVSGSEKKSILNRYGLYWIGTPPFHKIHGFKIKKAREKSNVPANAPPKEWISAETEEDETELRFTFPRPYVYPAVELSDNFSVDILVVAKFEVVIPAIPIYIFKGRFFENAGGIVQSFVLDTLRSLDWGTFLSKEKGENGILGGLKDPNGPLNQQLEKQVGLRLVGISINQWDPADDQIKEAVRQKSLATREQEGELVRAETYAKTLIKRNEADVTAFNNLTEAKKARVVGVIEAMRLSGADHNEIARAASQILQAEAGVLRAEAFSRKDSPVTTLVEGGNTTTAIPIK